MDIILIVLVISLFFVAVTFFLQKKIPNNTVIGFTGGLGSGKTYIGVRESIKHYKGVRMLLFFNRLFPFLKLVHVKQQPLFLSNIPIYLGRKYIFFGKEIWSKKLTYEHLTLVDTIPEYSTVFVDEFGAFASQYDFDNPFVMQYLQEFLRFFRHYTDGRLIFTDQSSSNIVVALRRRMNQIYNLSDFHRSWFFFFKVNVTEIHMLEDTITTLDSEQLESLPYFFGYLPFKYLRFLNPFKKPYDSRCYSINYKPLKNLDPDIWKTYKTNYFIDLPNNYEMRKQYKKDGYIKVDDMMKYLAIWQSKGVGVGGEGDTLAPHVVQNTDDHATINQQSEAAIPKPNP
jgi:hypothetical protein